MDRSRGTEGEELRKRRGRESSKVAPKVLGRVEGLTGMPLAERAQELKSGER